MLYKSSRRTNIIDTNKAEPELEMPATESRSRTASSEGGCSISADTESPDSVICLSMECDKEELSEAQTNHYQV